MKKRILSLLLTLVMALSLLPAPAFAENTGEKNYLADIVFGTDDQFTSSYTMTPSFSPSIHKYSLVIPDSASYTYIRLTLGKDAPTGSKGIFSYEGVEDGWDEKSDLEGEDKGQFREYMLWSFLSDTCSGNTLIFKAGTDDDYGTYTFTVKRQSTLNGATLKSSLDGTAIIYAKLEPTKTEGYTAYIPYAGAYLVYIKTCANNDETVTVNGSPVTTADKYVEYKLDASALWQGSAGSRHFDLTIKVQGKNETSVPSTYTVACYERPSKLEVTKMPTQTTYLVGDPMDTTGMEVYAYYGANGTEKAAVDLKDLTIDPLTLSQEGTVPVTISYRGASTTLDVTVKDSLVGSGTKDDPYILNTANGLQKLSAAVAGGNTYAGKYFKLTSDITLAADWEPIGCLKSDLEKGDYSYGHKVGTTIFPFSGSIDGNNKTLTVPEGGKPLLGYVFGAEVKNLNIYGEKINGYGLVNDLHGVGLHSSAIVIDNVTLKSGSSTLKSGLIGAEIDKRFNSFAGASADCTVTIRNCTIEKGVVVGYDGTQSEIGSIAGRMQGTVENCVSYATVKGVHYVGGIIGTKDNSMGDCTVSGCTFGGTVEASGNNAGGIVGGGYNDSSAPNGVHIGVKNCSVTKDAVVSGKENVGGILGGDEIVAQAWNSYAITDNTFLGKVKGEKNVGGIIGYYRSLNKFDNISNNIYAADCGATKGIGAVEFVDTNQYANLMKKDGATYFNTSKMEVSKEDPYTLYLYAEDGKLVKGPYVAGCWWKADHNRTDDPLGKDAVKLCRSTNESLLPDDNGAGTPGATTPATGDTGVTLWVIALPTAVLAAAFVLKRKEREA